MGKEDSFSRISIDSMSSHRDVIVETRDLVVSKQPNNIKDYPFDLGHPNILEGFGFTLCTRGSAKIRINLTEYDIRENMLGVYVPNSIVQILQKSEDLQIELLFCSFDFISNLQIVKELAHITDEQESQSCIHLDDDRFNQLISVKRMVVGEYENPHPYRKEIVKNLIQVLILKVLQCYSELKATTPKSNEPRHDAIYRKFMSLLFKHSRSERHIGFYADKLSLTPKYFSRIIKEVSGKSAGEWINEMVIISAKGFLKSTEMTISQIADELNFSNASFFGTYFKKYTGYTPNQYRAS